MNQSIKLCMDCQWPLSGQWYNRGVCPGCYTPLDQCAEERLTEMADELEACE